MKKSISVFFSSLIISFFLMIPSFASVEIAKKDLLYRTSINKQLIKKYPQLFNPSNNIEKRTFTVGKKKYKVGKIEWNSKKPTEGLAAKLKQNRRVYVKVAESSIRTSRDKELHGLYVISGGTYDSPKYFGQFVIMRAYESYKDSEWYSKLRRYNSQRKRFNTMRVETREAIQKQWSKDRS